MRALASGRAPPSPARISGEPTGTASGLAALGDRHADRTAGGLPLRLIDGVRYLLDELSRHFGGPLFLRY